MEEKHYIINEQPYEKFLRLGAGALNEEELLAIIIRTGTRNHTALELAHMILSSNTKKKPCLNYIHHISLTELKDIPGIGEVKAVKIKCIAELAARMSRERAALTIKFDDARKIADYYMETMRHLEKEQVRMLLLDTKLGLIDETIVSEGTVNSSLLSTREIFIRALALKACNLVLLHNHPSGDPKPSKQDILITKKVKEAGELLDIFLIDHIILGDHCYVSFQEEFLL